MNTRATREQSAEASSAFKARIAGVFYLLVFLTGGFALFAGGRFVVPGDAAATAIRPAVQSRVRRSAADHGDGAHARLAGRKKRPPGG